MKRPDCVQNACKYVLIAFDSEGLIRIWNPGAERILGYAAEQAVGQSLDLITPERLRKRHREGYRKTMATGESRYGEGALLSEPGIRKDGRQISLEFTIVPLKGEQGAMTGMVAAIRDVTIRLTELKFVRALSQDHRGACRHAKEGVHHGWTINQAA